MPLPPAPVQRASRLTHKAFEESTAENEGPPAAKSPQVRAERPSPPASFSKADREASAAASSAPRNTLARIMTGISPAPVLSPGAHAKMTYNRLARHSRFHVKDMQWTSSSPNSSGG